MEIRKFSIAEVARIFGIPPHKLGDLERATFSNIEEQNIDYVISTLRRWLVRWEQECNRKLIAPLEKTQQFTEHLVDGLLRGNIQSRYGAYSQGITNGFLSPNDIRVFENLDPIDGGNTYLVQGAMVPLDRLDDLIDARIERASQTDTLTPAAAGATEPMPDTTPETDEDDPDGAGARQDLHHSSGRSSWRVCRPRWWRRSRPRRSRCRPPSRRRFRDLWREAAFSVIAGTLVRRERAQLRKRQVRGVLPRRFVPEAMDELRPWLLPVAGPRGRGSRRRSTC